MNYLKYNRIAVDLKIEKYINTSIASSPMGRHVILMIKYAEMSKLILLFLSVTS